MVLSAAGLSYTTAMYSIIITACGYCGKLHHVICAISVFTSLYTIDLIKLAIYEMN